MKLLCIEIIRALYRTVHCVFFHTKQFKPVAILMVCLMSFFPKLVNHRSALWFLTSTAPLVDLYQSTGQKQPCIDVHRQKQVQPYAKNIRTSYQLSEHLSEVLFLQKLRQIQLLCYLYSHSQCLGWATAFHNRCDSTCTVHTVQY